MGHNHTREGREGERGRTWPSVRALITRQGRLDPTDHVLQWSRGPDQAQLSFLRAPVGPRVYRHHRMLRCRHARWESQPG